MGTTIKHNQAGIGHMVVLLLVVFAGVVGFAGWKVMDMSKADKTETSNVTKPAVVPDKIEDKNDLVETSKALDEASSEVDSGLNDSALNADMNDML